MYVHITHIIIFYKCIWSIPRHRIAGIILIIITIIIMSVSVSTECVYVYSIQIHRMTRIVHVHIRQSNVSAIQWNCLCRMTMETGSIAESYMLCMYVLYIYISESKTFCVSVYCIVCTLYSIKYVMNAYTTHMRYSLNFVLFCRRIFH